MKQDQIKTNEGSRSTGRTETARHNKINPFKETGETEDKREGPKQDDAIAEQQRKEALTERD